MFKFQPYNYKTFQHQNYLSIFPPFWDCSLVTGGTNHGQNKHTWIHLGHIVFFFVYHGIPKSSKFPLKNIQIGKLVHMIKPKTPISCMFSMAFLQVDLAPSVEPSGRQRKHLRERDNPMFYTSKNLQQF